MATDNDQEAKFIRFREVAAFGKTQRWIVETLTGVNLGAISWYGAWRQYCFRPNEMTIFERQCLRDIAQFCESRTRAYRALPKLKIEEKGGPMGFKK